ncbi:hypothetical protein VTK73DRAFT_4893 [Phialemonium thermophilum]|uniref:Uncharacterized protein n=1 Tax=Phialemonium thermophilum TaxID=223376 RepID=A0ABR3V613_9PEZI
MLVARGPTVLVDPDEEILISGAGDGTIKLWRLSDERRRREGVDEDEDEDSRDGRDEEEDDDEEEQRGGDIREIMVLGEDDGESVMSLAVDASFLYAGKLRGIIELWDLDTKQKLRVIKAHDGDVMTLQMSWGLLWSGATGGSACKHSTVHYGRDADGRSQNVSQKYQCLGRWKAHDGKILASAATTHQGDQLFITGGNDDNVCIWRVNGKPEDGAAGSRQGGSSSSSSNNSGAADAGTQPEDMMISTLREFVSYKTVSSRPEFAEDCRKGATFLGSLFKRLGAHVEMLSAAAADRPHNPVVFARFAGKLEPAERRTRKGKWATDPFRLTGLNGYLYGRGVSDNKGPVVAALYAVTDLVQARALDSDVLFLIEGEEESGSRGFQEVVRRHRRTIGRVDYILLANSYWLDDEVPCLTYGLRGVLHATVCVDSSRPDLHSGVDGSHMVARATASASRASTTASCR